MTSERDRVEGLQRAAGHQLKARRGPVKDDGDPMRIHLRQNIEYSPKWKRPKRADFSVHFCGEEHCGPLVYEFDCSTEVCWRHDGPRYRAATATWLSGGTDGLLPRYNMADYFGTGWRWGRKYETAKIFHVNCSKARWKFLWPVTAKTCAC